LKKVALTTPYVATPGQTAALQTLANKASALQLLLVLRNSKFLAPQELALVGCGNFFY